MLQSLKTAYKTLPKSYANFILFSVCSGLRVIESLSAVRLIRNPKIFQEYYNEQTSCLEHFRFKEIFWRRTKHSYITILPKDIITDLVIQGMDFTPGSYDTVKLKLYENKLDFKLNYSRKIYASYLRQYGNVETELIDLLQGRIGKSVFVRHYYRPSLESYRGRVLEAVHKLKEQIESHA